MFYMSIINETNIMNFFVYLTKLFFISIFTFYSYLKIENSKNLNISKIFIAYILYLFTCIFCTIIKEFINSYASFIVLFLLISIINSNITKNTIGYSIILTLISFSMNCIFFFISLLVAFIITNKLSNINDFTELLIIVIINFLILFMFFKIRRFKYGFSFLKNINKNEYFDILILNTTVTIIFSFILLSNFHGIFTLLLIFSLILFTIIMFITIQKTLTLYYKQKLMKQQIEETNKELENKDKIIEKLQAENINFSKISHSIAHRQKSLEYKLDKLISSKNSDTNLSSTENLKSEINKISEDYLSSINNIKTIPDLQKTGIPKIDDMLSYMQSECFKNKINFILNIKGNIYYMTNHFISVDKLEILLADFIKNSIIAITCSKNINRTILLVLGYVNNSYELCISDTGIEFEIDTLRNLGCTATTTHKDTGGTGYGFMNTFDTLREFKASLVIEEIGLPNISNYTKSIKVIFDNKNEFIIRSYRYNEMKNLQFNSKAILEEL